MRKLKRQRNIRKQPQGDRRIIKRNKGRKRGNGEGKQGRDDKERKRRGKDRRKEQTQGN